MDLMKHSNSNFIANGVMLNAYPDSIGENLSDAIKMLEMPQFKDAFSLFYVLPTFFNSDLDRGFSIIDYDRNQNLVSLVDLDTLNEMGIQLKFDIVLNHLSVASPQFKDLLANGEKSKYKEFFIDWNDFWKGNGKMVSDGSIQPKEELLSKLFMRKSGLPILKVHFPDGTERPYWNTFYQEISYNKIYRRDLEGLKGLSEDQKQRICQIINDAIENNEDFQSVDFKNCDAFKDEIIQIVNKKRSYLGQMDLNAKSELVWDFYEETLKKLSTYGCKLLRLDAFAYLHKQIGESNFFNKPGTWKYLDRIKQIALKYDLSLLPEIHAEYGLHLHDEVAGRGYYIYDFFLPGLVIHTIENATSKALLNWVTEILEKGYKTVNMLGCHDGIPVLDLKGKTVKGINNHGLLSDEEIEIVMNKIIARGGRVKNIYDPSGNKISYYQVNATFFSALGEDPKKLLLARAIQLFMPGIPQVWYLDLFAGKNDYEAANAGGSSVHKEINRTSLSSQDVEIGLKKSVVSDQLKMIRLRNTSRAFSGSFEINKTPDSQINWLWKNNNEFARLTVNLSDLCFSIEYSEQGTSKRMTF